MYVLRNYACSLLTVALLLAGCGQSGELDRRAVEGSVQVNGDALARGQIVFAPQPGTVGPAGSAVIDAGKFAIDADSGLVPGEYRVEIQALPAIDFEIDDDVAFTQRARQQRRRQPLAPAVIPPQFNSASRLTATVQPDEDVSSFQFAIEFRPQRRLASR